MGRLRGRIIAFAHALPFGGASLPCAALACALSFQGLGCITKGGAQPKVVPSTVVAPPVPTATTNPGDTGEDEDSGLITLTRVVKSQISPDTTVDLVGDGTGAIGSFCIDDSQGGAAGQSTCSCTFDYMRADGSKEKFDVSTSYIESNMIRCPYTTIASGVTSVNVKIHVINADAYSNTVVLSFTQAAAGAGSSAQAATDTSDPNSYLPVHRYQCKDNVTIRNMFDGTLYDPLQSAHPSVSYNLNFYTTNLGGAYGALAAASNANPQSFSFWNCPNQPNSRDSRDMYVYSEDADTSDATGGGTYQKVIYTPDNTQRADTTGKLKNPRSDFVVARVPVGVFRTPINALIAPNIVTTPPDDKGNQPPGSSAPLGYGVEATATTQGEVCPDSTLSPYKTSTTIPAGYKWVKLWLLRSYLLPRQNAVTSDKLALLGSVLCNPGMWGNNPAFDPGTGNDPAPGAPLDDAYSAFKDCAMTNTTPQAAMGSRLPLKGTTDLSYLTMRVCNSGWTGGNPGMATLCLFPSNTTADYTLVTQLVKANTGGGAATGAHGGITVSGGTDIFARNFVSDTPIVMVYSSGTSAGISTDAAMPAGDIASLFMSVATPATNYTGGKKSVLGSTTTKVVSIDGKQNRIDFLFVVTPTSVMAEQMRTETSAARPYLAYRYRTWKDCKNGANPSINPDSDACANNPDLRFDYKPVLAEINANPNAAANDPMRFARFPVCVLQKEYP